MIELADFRRNTLRKEQFLSTILLSEAVCHYYCICCDTCDQRRVPQGIWIWLHRAKLLFQHAFGRVSEVSCSVSVCSWQIHFRIRWMLPKMMQSIWLWTDYGRRLSMLRSILFAGRTKSEHRSSQILCQVFLLKTFSIFFPDLDPGSWIPDDSAWIVIDDLAFGFCGVGPVILFLQG